MKSAVELNRLFSKFLLLCQVDIQGTSGEHNATFTFLEIIWESKRSWRVYFSGFLRPQIPNF